MKPSFILVKSEGQHVPQVGLHLHGPHQHDAVTAREGFELMPFPRATVLGNTQPAEPQALCFQNEVLWIQTTIAASLGGVDVEVEEPCH